MNHRRSRQARSRRSKRSKRRSARSKSSRRSISRKYYGVTGDKCPPRSSVNVLEAADKKNLTKVPDQFLTKIKCYANCPIRSASGKKPGQQGYDPYYKQVDEEAYDPFFKEKKYRRKCNSTLNGDVFMLSKTFLRDRPIPIPDEINDIVYEEFDTPEKMNEWDRQRILDMVKYEKTGWTDKSIPDPVRIRL